MIERGAAAASLFSRQRTGRGRQQHAMKGKIMTFPEVQGHFEKNDVFWSFMTAIFVDIAHRNAGDELAALAVGLDELITRAQKEIASRN
jgi:hypothetical protein